MPLRICSIFLCVRSRLLDSFQQGNRVFLVTELLGETLYENGCLLGDARLGIWTPAALSELALKLLETLAVMHAHQVTHGDIKPTNLCFRESGQPRSITFIDFGSATFPHDSWRCSYYQSRWYRAPEVILGLPWDEKVDVWSLGVTLAELVLGAVPFRFGTSEMVLAGHTALCGPIPEWMAVQGPLSTMLLASPVNRVSYEIDPPGVPSGAYLLHRAQNASLHSLLVEAIAHAPAEHAAEYADHEGLCAFLGMLLTVDPRQRPSAAEARQHPWLRRAAARLLCARMRWAARTLVALQRWRMRAMERTYAPTGAGFGLARASFAAHVCVADA